MAIANGATLDSPVIVEFNCFDLSCEADDLVQASIEDVKAERRCEDDDEPCAVYIHLKEES